MLINGSNKKVVIYLLIFLGALIIYNLLIPRVLFGDVDQYVGVAKEFAGINNSSVHNPHSFIYSLLISPFLKIFPYLITIKIINLIWLVLISILLYKITKTIKIFLIWVFSPIVWYMAGYISPVLPTAFFITWSYLLFKKWEKTNKVLPFILSAISLGISSMLWDGIIFINLLFILVFFFNQPLKNVFFYGLTYSIIFSLRFVVDYIIFKFPFYSITRFFGAWLVILLGLNKIIKAYVSLEFLWIPVVISPLLFMLYKINYRKYLKEICFLLFSLIIFSPMGEIKYLLTITPIIIILLDKVLKSKKIVLIHILSSLIIIFLLVNPFFFGEKAKNELLIREDLNKIDKDFSGETIIAGGEEDSGLAGIFSVLYWGKNIPEFIWANEYYLSIKNQTIFTQYSFESKPIIKESRKLKIFTSLERPDLRNFDNIKYVIVDKLEKIPISFKLVKCYNYLCIYEK